MAALRRGCPQARAEAMSRHVAALPPLSLIMPASVMRNLRPRAPVVLFRNRRRRVRRGHQRHPLSRPMTSNHGRGTTLRAPLARVVVIDDHPFFRDGRPVVFARAASRLSAKPAPREGLQHRPRAAGSSCVDRSGPADRWICASHVQRSRVGCHSWLHRSVETRGRCSWRSALALGHITSVSAATPSDLEDFHRRRLR